ncbi:IclR family transcriptional regulator [Embleya sp. NPDC127516]|uniref:IclR family transcriptional regulator n=1 Tax=Embleya sp. NPDC127516 TaxID=3363990 RepID=UPI0038081AFA
MADGVHAVAQGYVLDVQGRWGGGHRAALSLSATVSTKPMSQSAIRLSTISSAGSAKSTARKTSATVQSGYGRSAPSTSATSASILRETALPFLQDLFEATRETVHLGVREGHGVVYVERIHGHGAPLMPSRIGGSLPLTCTGVGKALLAFSSPELTEEVLAALLPRLAPHSITEPAGIRTAIEQVQASGLAYEDQESALGVSCIAAPVFSGGEAVAALSVAVPRSRFRPAQLAPAVRTTALGLSRVLRAGA